MEASIQQKFDSYPDEARKQLLQIRETIFDIAQQEHLGKITETLKWGEPSYLTRYGSTIRIDWKKNKPDQYAMYFKCTTNLVETFRKKYPTEFPQRIISICQNVEQGQVWNITFLTIALKTLNIKLDAKSGEVIHSDIVSFFEFRK